MPKKTPSDDRFSRVYSDPKFRTMRAKERKVVIDDRFASMFDDKKFKLEYSVDKRGRPLSDTSSQHLRKYYQLEEAEGDDESEQNEEQNITKPKKKRKRASLQAPKKHKKKVQKDDSDSDSSAVQIDLARGEGNLSSSSDSDGDWSLSDGELEQLDHKWGELDADAQRTEEPTRRLAVCNQHWDRIRAQDLLLMLRSFAGKLEEVTCVTVYVSDFGSERLEREKIEGPMIGKVEGLGDEESGDKDRLNKLQMEKVRQYELDRLRYYYAVVECANIETANTIYEQCDGLEYESSSTKLDLRFIPDSMDFSSQAVKESASSVNVEKYAPRLFHTSALQQSNVSLSWDQTDPERHKTLLQAFKDDQNIEDGALKDYVASSSSDEEAEGDTFASLAKNLLSDGSAFKKDVDDGGIQMEISWEPGLELEEETETPQIEQEASEPSVPTPWQQYLTKRKEKRRQHKTEIKQKKLEARKALDDDKPLEPEEPSADLDLLVSEEKREKGKDFKLKNLLKEQKMKEKQKSKSKATVTGTEFELNVSDKRFSSLYDDPKFNIDPSDPNYKKTELMEKLVHEKVKRKKKNSHFGPKKVSDTDTLLESVKLKSNRFKK